MSFSFIGCVSSSVTAPEGRKITFSNASIIEDIASEVSSAVVGIRGIGINSESVGSGVCVSKNNLVLTNSHVVNSCNKIELHLADKSTALATIVYEDTVLDLAILKSNKTIPYLALGDSDNLRVGEDILAVGTPLSLSLTHTFTKGIISALNRTLKVGGYNGEGFMQNLIQHDASLNPGNSGGPLINSKGEVIGINTLKITSGEGIGFAIPTKSFKSLLSNLVKNINYKIPYLGVYGLDSEVANYQGYTDIDSGFYVIDIANNSPLKSIGLNNGCVITSIDGKNINNTLDLKEILYSLSSTDVVEIEYYYNGEWKKSKTNLIKF